MDFNIKYFAENFNGLTRQNDVFDVIDCQKSPVFREIRLIELKNQNSESKRPVSHRCDISEPQIFYT